MCTYKYIHTDMYILYIFMYIYIYIYVYTYILYMPITVHFDMILYSQIQKSNHPTNRPRFSHHCLHYSVDYASQRRCAGGPHPESRQVQSYFETGIDCWWCPYWCCTWLSTSINWTWLYMVVHALYCDKQQYKVRVRSYRQQCSCSWTLFVANVPQKSCGPQIIWGIHGKPVT